MIQFRQTAMKPPASFVWLFFAILVATTSPAAGQAKLLGLDSLPGATTSIPYGISSDGSVVVGSSPAYSNSNPAYWTVGQGWTSLTGLASSPRGNAYAASGNGSVVVGQSYDSTGIAAVRWSVETGVQDLGALQPGIRQNVAYGVSDSGDVVVGFATSGSSHQGFRWTETDGMVGLGFLDGHDESRAYDVSADGTAIVGVSSSSSSSITYQAFRWTSDTGMESLGQLASDGIGSVALAISSDGNVIAGYGRRLPGQHFEGFRWTAETGMVGIGDFPGGGHPNSVIRGMNHDGSIMVGDGEDETGIVAAIWDDTHGLRKLASYAEEELGVDLGGWTLTSAFAISDDGMRIVGNGYDPDGLYTGWILIVPEPGTSVFFFCLAGSLFFARRRSSV